MKSYTKIILFVVGLFLVVPTFAQESEPETVDIVNSILNRYTAWESVTFNGKLRTSMVKLPVTPTVKIYAVRDKLFQLSLSAPFLGEVGRVEITPETLTAVNKYNKTYVRESMTNLMGIYPGLLGNLQSLFLARMVILGQGEFNLENLDEVIFAPIEDGQWVLMPKDEESQLKYGYVVLPNGRTGALFGFLENRPENVTLAYGYNGGMQMNVEIDKGTGKNITGTLDFSSVKWGGNPMSAINLDRYRKVSLAQFVKNYK